jgi:hypothetical protein
MKKLILTLFYSSLATLFAVKSHADPVAVPLLGGTSYDGWNNLTNVNNPGFPGFPGSGAWPGAIGSNTAGSGDAVVSKTANGASGGGPTPLSQSIYFGSFTDGPNLKGGTLSVTDSTPLANLKTVVFQLEIGGANSGYDLWNGTLPALSYTTSEGGGGSLSSNFSFTLAHVANGSFTSPLDGSVVPVYLNLYAEQWDLSAVSGTINSLKIDFSGVMHSQVYAMRLDQSDHAYGSVAAVPEPSTYGLLAVGGSFAIVAFRRKCRAAGGQSLQS